MFNIIARGLHIIGAESFRNFALISSMPVALLVLRFSRWLFINPMLTLVILNWISSGIVFLIFLSSFLLSYCLSLDWNCSKTDVKNLLKVFAAISGLEITFPNSSFIKAV